MNLKSYWVLWTYIANYSKLTRVEARDAEDAMDMVTGHFSKDFQKKATVYVFDREPILTSKPA